MEMKIPEFKESDLEKINDWVKRWDKWRKEKKVGFPDYTRETILLIPLILALLKAEARLSILTITLIILTSVLAIETALIIGL